MFPLTDEGSTGARDAYSEASYAGTISSLRTTDGLKLIYDSKDEGLRCFDLRTDPREERTGSVRDCPALGERLQAWAEVNHAMRGVVHGDSTGDDEIILDEEIQRRLEALGYIR